MRGLLVGRPTIATGVAITAAAGLIAATPPTPARLDLPVTHRAVALAAAPSVSQANLSPRELLQDTALVLAGVTVIVTVGGPVAATLGAAATVVATARAFGVLDKSTDWLKDKVLEQLPIDRIVEALPREFKAEGEVIARLLETQRLASLTDFDTLLTSLQNRLDQRQKFTDKEIEKAKVNLTGVLGVVGTALGFQIPTSQVYSWFDQAEVRFDDNYDKLEAALQKVREHLRSHLDNPSAAAQPSARPAVSSLSSSRKSVPRATATSAAARPVRQAGKPAPANTTGKATKSHSAHARSARAAK